MERIVIIGCGGSGKTTVGRVLATITGAPLTHLDAIYYDDDWNSLAHDKFAAVQDELVAAPRWIIEGNYASTLPIRLQRADTVVFLDLPALTCLWGIMQRRLSHRGGQHRRTGVFDRITWGFIRYVWGYRRSMAPRVRSLITEYAPHATVHILRSRRAANAFLAEVGGKDLRPFRGDSE